MYWCYKNLNKNYPPKRFTRITSKSIFIRKKNVLQPTVPIYNNYDFLGSTFLIFLKLLKRNGLGIVD